MNEYPYLSQALSQVIENIRKERKMTKSALAEFAWIERRHLREIEVGNAKPSLNVVYSICDALRVSPPDFFRLMEEEREKLQAKQESTENIPGYGSDAKL